MKFRKRVKRLIITTGLLVTLGLGLGAGSMTAYAAGPGEVSQTATQQTQAQTEQSATVIVSYAQAQVSTLGSWEADQTDPSIFRFKQFTGEYLTNAWVESLTTQGTWYFVGADGLMLKNSTTPDNFYVDANGEYRAPIASSTASHNTPGSTDSTTDTHSQTSQSQQTPKQKSKGPNWIGEGAYIDNNANAGIDIHG